jgi:CubicO group peptidase (beta-lactamase class C family)/N-acyl-D-aspartate/D-glutamate deacylase
MLLSASRRGLVRIAIVTMLIAGCSSQPAGVFDLVIANGRVIDPESALDAVRHLGVRGGTIAAVSETPLQGTRVIDAANLVVSPGFIDLHEHGQQEESYRMMVRDGVTSAFELEVGTGDVGAWYAQREGGQLVNYGVSIGHIPARMKVLGDPGKGLLPAGVGGSGTADETQLRAIEDVLREGIRQGAVAMGFGSAYTPGATIDEIERMFRIAAAEGLTAHIHMRGGIAGLHETIAAAKRAGAALHIVHVNSSAGDELDEFLAAIAAARAAGQDVTTEAYPYGAGMTEIQSALFDDWRSWPDARFADHQLVSTGERLTRKTFEAARNTGGTVIIHGRSEEQTRAAIASPLAMIASDGFIENGRGHPRTSGTYAKVLGRYVRDGRAVPLTDALRRMTLEPAQRLAARVPAMSNKGRIRAGADADLTIFNPATVIDRSTYEDATIPSAGIPFVVVAGQLVVDGGELTAARPGRAVRAPIGSASGEYPPQRFTDPDRVARLESALPDIDRLFQAYAADRKIPGMIWGVVIDGRLAHVASTGVRDRASKAPVTPDTAFRIASMTKSFTALAILKLRDEGRLSLDDPVSKWIPQFAKMELPTRDSAPLRVRQLMSHSAGFPEDNPWGDQQLSATDEALDAWLAAGIPFSTPPGTRYEYSNYAFGLLGRIVSRASGMPYEQYMREHILEPLGMRATTFEFSTIPQTSRAIGYRLKPDGTYAEEPPLPHGVFGAMGGLLTTAGDLGRYVAFHLSAWPARDDPDTGPVNRASVREMAHLWTPANLTARATGGAVQATQSGYGYGLRIAADCRFDRIVSHGGGLPGFGSFMQWLPDYGVGMFAMATLTYAGPSEPISSAWDVMLKTGALRPREWQATARQIEMRDHVFNLWTRWDDAEVARIAAVNFLLDAPAAQRQAEIRALKNDVGECAAAGPVRAENWLRGQVNLQCDTAIVGAFFTLAPTRPPALQHLEFRRLASAAERMGAPTGAPAGVSCRP